MKETVIVSTPTKASQLIYQYAVDENLYDSLFSLSEEDFSLNILETQDVGCCTRQTPYS